MGPLTNRGNFPYSWGNHPSFGRVRIARERLPPVDPLLKIAKKASRSKPVRVLQTDDSQAFLQRRCCSGSNRQTMPVKICQHPTLASLCSSMALAQPHLSRSGEEAGINAQVVEKSGGKGPSARLLAADCGPRTFPAPRVVGRAMTKKSKT